ncbi:MAG TPA: 3-dehydroquinate synthase [Mycobacteriales bacterium]|nr:3-dehydroquinate synthase [Mycobacteriales bacterium]
MRVGGEASYDVVIGRDLAGQVPPLVGAAATVALVADPAVTDVAEAVAGALHGGGVHVETLTIPAGEAGKSLITVAGMWDDLGRMRLTRSDAIVAVGGGATTDVAGFAAATWLRGVRLVSVPTTLLAMVDAAIGGKTGINTAAGKNLVGAFHPPAGVLVDLDVLQSLPAQQWVNGMAEVVKAGFIADPEILDLVEADVCAAALPTSDVAVELIEHSAAVKVDVVSRDLRESGPREILNYGHTLGHAIERLEDYRMPHGHAVAIGMVFAAGLAHAAGLIAEDTLLRHKAILGALGLPTTYRADALPELLELMRVDKKARGAKLRFVVLEEVGKPMMLEDPEPALLDAAYREVAA